MYCTQCGTKATSGANYCGNCGAELQPTPVDESFSFVTQSFESNAFASGIRRPHPWLRYFARIIDFSWFSLLVLGIGHNIVPDKIIALRSSVYSPLLSIGVLWVWCFVEPVFLVLKGATPGKWLCGISLRTSGRWGNNYSTYFERSFRVLLTGMFLGVPPFSFIGFSLAYRGLKSTGVTSWDRYLNIDVIHDRLTIAQALMAFSTFAGSVAAIVYFFS